MSEMVERVARIFDQDAYLPEGSAGILLPRKIRRADAEGLARKAIAAVLDDMAADAAKGGEEESAKFIECTRRDALD